MLEYIAKELLEKETLDQTEFEKLMENIRRVRNGENLEDIEKENNNESITEQEPAEQKDEEGEQNNG